MQTDNAKTGAIRCFIFLFYGRGGPARGGAREPQVLHYYLEDHISVAAPVDFVAIKAHLLDVAKANHCAQRTRAKSDHKELMSIARVVLGAL